MSLKSKPAVSCRLKSPSTDRMQVEISTERQNGVFFGSFSSVKIEFFQSQLWAKIEE